MEYGKLVGDAFAYAKDGLFGNLGIWFMLLILTVLPVIPIFGWVIAMVMTMKAAPDMMVLAGGFGIALILAVILSAFYTGYTLKILRAEVPLPPVAGFATLFDDGIRYLIIQAIYMIPAIIIFCATVLPAMLPVWAAAISGQEPAGMSTAVMTMIGGIFLTVVVAFVIGLFALIGVARFARTGSMGEAFNFSAIRETIGRIGWGAYIVAMIIMMVIVMAVSLIVGMIPVVGGIIHIVITPFIGVFSMRYVCLLYDSAGTA